jgi:hypothetical protein
VINVINFISKNGPKWPKISLIITKSSILFLFYFLGHFLKTILQVAKIRQPKKEKKKKEKEKTTLVEVTEKPKHERTHPPVTVHDYRLRSHRYRPSVRPTERPSVRQSDRPSDRTTDRPSCHWRVAGARYTTFARSLV